MSFLELEDDPQATLAVALAFIDACEEHDDGTSHSSSSEGHWSADDDDDDNGDADVATTDSHVQQQSPPPPPQSLTVFIRDSSLSGYLPLHHHQKQQQQQQARRSQTGKMTKSRAHSVKKHRERKKYEVATLREQAAQLEAKLARLQRSSAMYGSGSRRSAAHRQLMRLNTRQEQQQHQVLASQLQKSESWLEVAALRESERFQSEALNLKLKDALRRQIIATKALEGVLGKKKTEGLELLSDHQKKLRSHNANGDSHMMIRTVPPAVETASLLVRLQAELRQMYLLTDSMVMNYGPGENEWVTETAPSSSSSSCVLHANLVDVGSAMFTEMRTTTFVRCSFQEAGQVMWQGSSPKQSTSQTGKNVVVRQALTSSSFQKSFSLVLEDPDRTTPVGLHGTAYMHKFEEANRFMFIWTSSITMADNGPKFIEKGWIVTTPCPKQSVEGRPASVVRTCYQAFSCPEAQGAEASSSLCSGKDPETRQKMAFLIKWLSRKMRNYNQQMENVFLDKY